MGPEGGEGFWLILSTMKLPNGQRCLNHFKVPGRGGGERERSYQTDFCNVLRREKFME